MIDLDRPASERDLRVFGGLLPLFLGGFGAWLRWDGHPVGAWTLWGSAVVLGAAFWAVPALRRPLYGSWMFVVRPLGWAISHLAMAIVYYGLITPMGLLLRALVRDPMRRGFLRDRASYWIPRPEAPAADRYFRQF